MCIPGAHDAEGRTLDSLALQVWMVVWVLKTKARSSGRSAVACNYQVISPNPCIDYPNFHNKKRVNENYSHPTL